MNFLDKIYILCGLYLAPSKCVQAVYITQNLGADFWHSSCFPDRYAFKAENK